MSENEDDIIDYRIQLQNLVRTGNHVVHALRAVLDMLGVPICRGAAETVLKSQIDLLRHQLELSSPKIDEVAQEYLHPRDDIWLEFGMHDSNNAYLNYNVPITSTPTGTAIAYITNALYEAAEEIVRDANDYEDLDDYDPREWISSSEPTWFDRDGNEIENYERFSEVKTIQIEIMRKEEI